MSATLFSITNTNTNTYYIDHYFLGEYEPNYDKDLTASMDNSTNGQLTEWDSDMIVWQTADGKKPLDNPKVLMAVVAFEVVGPFSP